MFLRVQNILQTPGCCRTENVTIPWTEIYLHQLGLAKIPESWQQCFFKGSSFPLLTFLSLQVIGHIPAISTELCFLGTEASVGLNQDPAAQLLLCKSNHRGTMYITGLRMESSLWDVLVETSFAFILYSQRISLSLPVLQMGCRFGFFLFSEVRDHFTSLGSVLFFPCTTSAAVFLAWIVPRLVLKGTFQKCLWGYELLVIVLSSRVFFICHCYFPF